ncbi:MAG: Ig-like domain-containing protein, partial [Chloroflexota bacterium]
NQPMDEATTRNAISLVRDDGAAVPLELGWNDIRTAVTITPTQSLSFDSRYTFTVQDTAQSAAGGELRFGKVFRINTVGFPAISYTEPADGATQKDFSSGFSIFFDTEMDRDSLEGKVIIEPPITGDPNGQYNRWRRSLSFWGLSPATDYTVTILPGMSDPYGNVLSETRTFTFRTANRDPFVAIEMNYPFALYRYNGSSAAWVRNINVNDFQMNVYRLDDFTQFFRMVDRYDINNYSGLSDELVQVETGTGEPESNQTNYARFDLRDENGNMHPPGFYYVTLNSPNVNYNRGRHDDARPIIIANGNLTLKTTHDEAFAWLTSLESAAPIAGQEVVLYDESFNVVSSAVTNAEGIASMTGLELETGWGGTYYALVNSDTHTAAAITNWNEGVSPWDFGIRADYYSYNNNLRGYIYTDRPLYRPDQTVFIKGIVRLDDDLNYTIPDLEQVDIEIYNFEGEIYKDRIQLNSMGSFSLELELDSEAVLGDYSIQISQGRGPNREWIGSGIFSVAEYRKPTFKVDVETTSENFVDGDQVDATVKAEFFSGGGVSNSELTWSLTAQNTTFQPSDPNLTRYSFNTAERDRRFYFDPYDDFNRGQVIASGQGTTNGSGEFPISLPAELESETGTRRMTLETVVTDLAGNVVAGRSIYTVHPGSQYAGIKAAQYIGVVDEPMGLDLVVIDLNSQVIPNAAVDIEVVKRNWFSVQEDDGNGGLVWKSTVEEVPVD